MENIWKSLDVIEKYATKIYVVEEFLQTLWKGHKSYFTKAIEETWEREQGDGKYIVCT